MWVGFDLSKFCLRKRLRGVKNIFANHVTCIINIPTCTNTSTYSLPWCNSYVSEKYYNSSSAPKWRTAAQQFARRKKSAPILVAGTCWHEGICAQVYFFRLQISQSLKACHIDRRKFIVDGVIRPCKDVDVAEGWMTVFEIEYPPIAMGSDDNTNRNKILRAYIFDELQSGMNDKINHQNATINVWSFLF